MREERNGNFDKMDEKMKEFMSSSKFENMSDEDKKKMMSMFMFQMGSNMQTMMKDREEDDDVRKRMGYYKQDSNGKQRIESQVQFQQGKRSEQRMPVTLGESRSVCYPSQYYKGDEYVGGKNGVLNDAMKGGMKDMEKGEDSEGMMKQGMRGMGGMMDKMNGMEGMFDKMSNMSEADQK